MSRLSALAFLPGLLAVAAACCTGGGDREEILARVAAGQPLDARTYTFDEPVILGPGDRLVGAGRGRTILEGSVVARGTDAEFARHVHIADLSVVGGGIRLYRIAESTVERVTVFDAPGHGIELESSIVNAIRDSKVSASGGKGVYVHSRCNGNVLDGVRSMANFEEGVEIDGPESFTNAVVGGSVESNGWMNPNGAAGIRIGRDHPTRPCTILRVHLERNRSLGHGQVRVSTLSSAVVQGCWIVAGPGEDEALYAVRLEDAYGVDLIGNETAAHKGATVYVTSSCRDCRWLPGRESDPPAAFTAGGGSLLAL